jgi:hypothetical protein
MDRGRRILLDVGLKLMGELVDMAVVLLRLLVINIRLLDLPREVRLLLIGERAAVLVGILDQAIQTARGFVRQRERLAVRPQGGSPHIPGRRSVRLAQPGDRPTLRALIRFLGSDRPVAFLKRALHIGGNLLQLRLGLREPCLCFGGGRLREGERLIPGDRPRGRREGGDIYARLAQYRVSIGSGRLDPLLLGPHIMSGERGLRGRTGSEIGRRWLGRCGRRDNRRSAGWGQYAGSGDRGRRQHGGLAGRGCDRGRRGVKPPIPQRQQILNRARLALLRGWGGGWGGLLELRVTFSD